jgi:hypothetical protein
MLAVAPLVFNAVIGAAVFFLFGGRKLLSARTHHQDAEPVAREAVAASAVTSGGSGSAGTATARGHGVQAAASPEDPAPDAASHRPSEAPADRVPGAAGDADRASEDSGEAAAGRIRLDQVATIVGLLVFAVLTVVYKLDVGFTSILIGVVIALFSPQATKGAVDKIAWSTVLLIVGVLTYVGVLQAAGTIDYISDAIAGLGAPLLAALLICYLGGVASAFASSVAILGVMIPLAIPFLQQGGIGAVGFIVALAIATTVVDVSPFSTNGALILANAQDIDRDRFYRQMLGYAAVVVVFGPLLAWAVFVLPGWL